MRPSRLQYRIDCGGEGRHPETGQAGVFSRQRPEALKVLEHRALELDIAVRHSSSWRVEDLVLEKFGSRFTLVADEEIPIACGLAGSTRWRTPAPR